MAIETMRAPGQMDLLRFSTAGSVDDGKGTLIGRLLYDSKGIFEDQLAAIEQTSKRRGNATVDLALLTDGLRAERDEASPSTSLIATSPRRGANSSLPTRRATSSTRATWSRAPRRPTGSRPHRRPSGLTRAVAPSRLHRRPAGHAAHRRGHQQDGSGRLERGGLRADHERVSRPGRRSSMSTTSRSYRSAPSTATTSSSTRPTCAGTAARQLLYHLERAHRVRPQPDRQPLPRPVRDPAQTDEHHDYRGYAGQVATGTFRKGDEVVVRVGPSTRIARVETFDGEVEEAIPPMSISMPLRATSTSAAAT